MASEIMAVGLACYDHLVVVPSLARAGEGARARAVLAQCGGISATAAVAAARLGARVELWTRVGSDKYGRFVADELRERGVDVSQLVTVEGGRTAVSTVLVDEGTGERRFLYCPSESLDSVDVVAEPPDYGRIDGAKALLVDGRWGGMCLRAAERAREAGVPVVTDVGHAQGEQLEILRLADWPVISEIAIGELAAGRELDEFADGLLEGNARAVVVTRGANGVWVRERGGRARSLGVFPVEVVDTTGAGDVFHGAFAYAVARGRDTTRAVEFGSAAATLACTALGGQTAAPGLREVERLFASPDRPHWRDAR